MRRLFNKSVRFLFVLGSLLIGIEVLLYFQMKDNRAHVLEDWEDIQNLETDFWVFGDSRTTNHVNPLAIQEKSGLSIYNLGYDGYRVRMGASRLLYAIKHAKTLPQAILVQSDNSFIADYSLQSKFPMKDGMLRYFWLDQQGINKHFRKYTNWRASDAYIPLLRYKGYPLIFFKHLLGWNRWDKKPLMGFWGSNKGGGFIIKEAPSEAPKQLSFEGMDSICKAHGIQLIGIIPPSQKSMQRPPQHLLDSLFRQNQFWDFSKLFGQNDSTYFKDRDHFNAQGATIYSDSIANLLITL